MKFVHVLGMIRYVTFQLNSKILVNFKNILMTG